MDNPQPQLRHDSAHAPPFLMVRRPPSSQEIKDRLAEWILSVWMNQLDPNVMGIRRVDDDKNGNGVPTVHIAIPLGYRRKQLAQTLSISQIEDEQTAPRVNLISSAGSDEAHSYIRVPAELIFSQFIVSMDQDRGRGSEHADHDQTSDPPGRYPGDHTARHQRLPRRLGHHVHRDGSQKAPRRAIFPRNSSEYAQVCFLSRVL
jgi:hypothetical protein